MKNNNFDSLISAISIASIGLTSSFKVITGNSLLTHANTQLVVRFRVEASASINIRKQSENVEKLKLKTGHRRNSAVSLSWGDYGGTWDDDDLNFPSKIDIQHQNIMSAGPPITEDVLRLYLNVCNNLQKNTLLGQIEDLPLPYTFR